MANDDNISAWNRTVVEEFRRFRSLRPRPGRVFRHTPMPPDVRAAVTKSLGVWPVPQINRDRYVSMVAKKMAGLAGPWRHGIVPEPEASRAAAAVEAKAFAAASTYAAGKDLTTDEGRAEVFKMYAKEVWARAYRYANRYAKSRPQAAAAGTSRARAAGPSAPRRAPAAAPEE